MKRKLLLSLALVGLMRLAFAYDMTDVTATYLQNFTAPFAATGDGLVSSNPTRFQKLAGPWVTAGDMGTMGTDYTAWHVDFQKSPNYPAVQADSAGVMTLTVGWDGFASAVTNMKVYQTVTLPAGDYEFTIRRAQDWSGAAQAYLVAALGTGLPNIENFATGALGSTVFSKASKNVVSVKFKLTAESTVSLGCVGSLTSNNCVTIANFKLFQTLGTDYRALNSLISTSKSFTNEQYPIGTISGTYSQAKWDALQTAIAAADAFVAKGETDTQANVDAQVAALQKAIDELNTSMVLPFKLSDDSKTYWYQIRDKRATKSYWQIGEYVNDTQNLTSALIMTQTDDNTNDAQLFKIYQAESGYYYIVNRSTDFPLSKFEDKLQTVRDSLPIEFNISRGVDLSHYIISLRTSGSQLNSYASYNPPYIGLYNDVTDSGNNWEFVEKIEEGQTNFTDLKTLVGKALAMPQSNYPANLFPVEKWNAFVTARTAATVLVEKETANPQPAQTEVDAMIVSLQQAIDNLNGSFIPQVELSTPEKSVYYFVQDKRATTNYWVIDGALRLGLTTALDSLNDMHMFKFVKSGTGNAFKIYCKAYPNNALSVSPDDANLIQINEAAADTTWIMGRTPAKDELYFTVGLESTKSQMNSYATEQYVGFWTPSSDDPGNDWKFVPVVNTAIKQVLATDLGIYVSNHRIVSKDASAKLNVFSVLGQKVNAKSELRPGVYMVQVAGKTGVAKVIVR